MAKASTRTTVGPRFSDGARLLWADMRGRGLSQGAFARLLGTQQGLISRYLYGDMRPRWDWATKFRDMLGIPLEAWTVPAALPFTLPANEHKLATSEQPLDTGAR